MRRREFIALVAGAAAVWLASQSSSRRCRSSIAALLPALTVEGWC